MLFAALYSTMFTNADHPASCRDLASGVLPRPDTARSLVNSLKGVSARYLRREYTGVTVS